jgi:hypothetical protein
MAFEWPMYGNYDLDFAVWMAHFMEIFNGAGCRLPHADAAGPDGVVRV